MKIRGQDCLALRLWQDQPVNPTKRRLGNGLRKSQILYLFFLTSDKISSISPIGLLSF